MEHGIIWVQNMDDFKNQDLYVNCEYVYETRNVVHLTTVVLNKTNNSYNLIFLAF